MAASEGAWQCIILERWDGMRKNGEGEVVREERGGMGRDIAVAGALEEELVFEFDKEVVEVGVALILVVVVSATSRIVSSSAVVSMPSIRSVVAYVSVSKSGKVSRIASMKAGLCKGPPYIGPDN